ncbi:uncharacterized protein PRCAT00000278001 [Priceomyces carsonii]|uniref:uncharacterized protein n=1 Tax=Priceomyces carsonii TaxID=28549 RepID=UPI002EDAA74D|nr:unnamed protein product [Priceomyces carsonii]
MPGETVTIHAGQCGNQVGYHYWNQLASEHGILPDGTLQPYPKENLSFSSSKESTVNNDSINRHDRSDGFFTSDNQRYTPRAILIDLEPSVIAKSTSALPMLNPRNIHLSKRGNGAANNWQRGYDYGLQYQDDLINLIDREVDKCDNLSNFQLMHSVAGGTGSGVGSLLLELLTDRYGSKKLINTFLIFPSNEKTSDVVVQPYNTMLTLKRLIDFSDATFIFENDALNNIENILSYKSNIAFEGANKLISYVLASLSNPLRFPNYMYSSFESILSTLIPTPDLKFITSSLAPANLNEYDTMLELSNDRYKLNSTHGAANYISTLNYLIGLDLKQDEIRKGTLRAQQRISFVPWTSSSIHLVNCKRSPFAKDDFKGLQVSNNTSMIHVFSKVVKQFDLLAKREAYINYYTDSNESEERLRVLDLFNDCKESVLHVIDEYKSCQDQSYLEDEILDDDELM